MTAFQFGIWHEYIPDINKLATEHGLTITRLHTHIGSGTDPAVWERVVQLSLDLVPSFPDVVVIDVGGGFKVGRMDDEKGISMTDVGERIVSLIKMFALTTSRKLHLELEPGTFLVANAGILLSRIDDIVDTGQDGYKFIKLDTGMNDILWPSLYGAQHPIAIVHPTVHTGLTKTTKISGTVAYVVVGHNCESGDILTPAPASPETVRPRQLPKATIGDLVVIGGAGAYCASLAAHGYNSFPDAHETLV